MSRLRSYLLAVACPIGLGLLAGCAGTPKLPPEIAAQPRLAEAAQAPSVIDVYDPLEPMNRAIYNFNAGFDRYVFLPIVRAYEFVTPVFVQDRVSDFFDNIQEIPTFANNVLQLKADAAGRSATRFIINTMFTAGLFDLADAGGVPRAPEDFGQTLGYWGAGPGPYLVIPVLGPSNLRDATGTAADAALLWAITPAAVSDTLAYTAARFGLQNIDTRHRIAFRYFETGSPFEYDLVRLIYTEKRELDIAGDLRLTPRCAGGGPGHRGFRSAQGVRRSTFDATGDRGHDDVTLATWQQGGSPWPPAFRSPSRCRHVATSSSGWSRTGSSRRFGPKSWPGSDWLRARSWSRSR